MLASGFFLNCIRDKELAYVLAALRNVLAISLINAGEDNESVTVVSDVLC